MLLSVTPINFVEVLHTICIYLENDIMKYDLQRGLTAPFVDDGLIEVVGFRDAWHGLVLLAPGGHGTRLAQVRNSTPVAFCLTSLKGNIIKFYNNSLSF